MKDDLKEETKRLIEEQEQRIAAFTARFQLYLDRNIRKILRGVKGRDIRAVEAASFLNELIPKLEETGLKPEMEEVKKIYAKELEGVKRQLELAEIKTTFSGADATYARELVKLDVSALQERVYGQLYNLQAEITRRLLGAPKQSLKATMKGTELESAYSEAAEKFSETLERNFQTEVRTGINSFHQRMVREKAADAEITTFEYMGPSDALTRPFCRKYVGKVLQKRDIDKLTNDAGQPAAIYCGGYNCRHQWVAISDERIEKLGLKVEKP